MNGLKQAFQESTVMQGFVTVMVLGVVCYLYVVEREVPDALLGFGGIILGFWFKTKASQ